MATIKTDLFLYGAVLLTDESIRDIVALLTSPLRDKVHYTHYNWVHEVTIEHDFDFIIAANLEHIAMLCKHYAAHNHPIPPIINFVRTAQLETLDYAVDFPGVTIYPIEYSLLDEREATLKYDNFYHTVQLLEKAKQANQQAPTQNGETQA